MSLVTIVVETSTKPDAIVDLDKFEVKSLVHAIIELDNRETVSNGIWKLAKTLNDLLAQEEQEKLDY